MFSRCLAPMSAAVCLLAGWELYCRLAGVSPLILPSPSGVLLALWRERTALMPHAFATLLTAALGFSLSVVTAGLLSVLFYAAPLLARALMPLLTVSQTIPLVALAPLMILWFGFGLLPKVLLVVLVTFLPMLISLTSGYREVPQDYRDLLRAMRASPAQIFRHAVLPGARASFLAGLRISATYAIVATIFAEYAGARRGLGIYILAAKNNFRADLVLAAVVLSAALTLLLLGLIRLLDRLTAPGPARPRDV